ncbi:hypothetical protein SELMODRAFT_91482 [Selaginella moellendorffii]|uniref:Protein kinase domain-containing protein n=1 Tax=Selaginella moellendorffii TaxID=88036 RepID=D8RE13_SELML|nr:serine/threonine-protein kinase PEPKR2 [Selaginella moellendorffii]EFJ29588.1 hypothetical protein SELMODRAFT_91482 [Selaginella moellendorffii]|eukprot:XP_002969500.1 serine/threonine-protein kinase PEPKR2 [Selaginella moellendorffii]
MASAEVESTSAWLESHYQVLGRLGGGAYGSVFVSKRKTKFFHAKTEACKVMDSKHANLCDHEGKIMRKLHGLEGVVSLHKAHKDSECTCLVMELCASDLMAALGTELMPYHVPTLANHFRHLVQTVQAMHRLEVVHRDLKPENILVTKKGELKVADFGVAVDCSSRPRGSPLRIQGEVGTRRYWAPEIVSGGGYDEKVDVFALGLILYFMLEMKRPFDGFDPHGECFFEERRLVFEQSPKAAQDLIMKMTEKDPWRRITLEAALKHPWLQKKKTL